MIIKDEKRKRAVIGALLDDTSRKILFSTTMKAKSVIDMMRQEDIPMTSAYRRVKELMEGELLEIERSEISEDGKRYHLYRSKIRNATLRYINGELEVDIFPNITPSDKLIRSFFTMKEVK